MMEPLKWEGDSMFDHGTTIKSNDEKPFNTDTESRITFNIPVVRLDTWEVEILADNRELTEEQWLELRKKGIGGSSVASILAPDKYGTAYTVALEKRPDYQHIDISDNFYIRRGKYLEDPVIVWFQGEFFRKTGVWINVYKSPFMYRNLKNKYQIMNIDGLCWVDEFILPDGSIVSGLGLIEVKTASPYVRKGWEETGEINDIMGDLPPRYWIQNQYYMDGLDLEFAILPFWIDGEINFRVIRRDRKFMKNECHPRLKVFCEQLEQGILPKPEGFAVEKKILMKSFPVSEEITVEDFDILPTLERIDELKLEKKKIAGKIEKEIEEVEMEYNSLQLQVKEKMKSAKYLKSGNMIATWTRYKKSAFTVPEQDAESFSVKRMKK